MTTRLYSITRTNAGDYEVVLDVEGERPRMR